MPDRPILGRPTLDRTVRRRLALALLLVGCLSARPGWAQVQIAPERTLEELKEETLERVQRGTYPANGLDLGDAREAIARIDSLDRDEWAAAWISVGDRYREQAERADGAAARDLYFRAFRLYSMGRFPTTNSPGKRAAYEKAVAAYLGYARFDMPALSVVRIPFEGKEIVGYLRLPEKRLPGGDGPAPLMVMWGGLDFLKEQAADNLLPMAREGFATFTVDMPGTGQAPIKVSSTADRMYSVILDWVQTRPEIDARKVFVWGTSWGGYWAAKVAATERDRIMGAIDQGGPADAYFRPEWQIKALGTREYLMDLPAARMAIYDGVTTIDQFLAVGPTMSLRALGILDRPTAPMLLFNGARDTQVPIEDLTVLLLHGSIKEAWVNPQGNHVAFARDWTMDRMTREVVMPWVQKVLAARSGR